VIKEMTETGKTEDDFSLLLMLRDHLLPRFGGARGTWELALLSTALTQMYVGLRRPETPYTQEKQSIQTI
jgi:hypothetical protein